MSKTSGTQNTTATAVTKNLSIAIVGKEFTLEVVT